MANPLLAPVLIWLGRLRHPQLFVVTGILLVANVLIPDVVPFIDELLLASLTLWLGSRKRPAGKDAPGSSGT
ncbi:hypothetical protein OS187_02410 [Xanthomonadaceae bacterium JHOS43]|nr:hypothetical protein [Xanthomonadaceae bacterium JHOS43]MCX7564156.1 hypothetical protein [Xanthomonadaceae bacterium XH05]